jgi:hypothetical protein
MKHKTITIEVHGGVGGPMSKFKRKPADMPVQESMCATCPWRNGSPYACLAKSIGKSALTESNRVCHSTGTSAIYPNGTGKALKFCRGARNLQLAFFAASGFISAPTDEAWYAKLEEMRANGSKI